MSGISREDKGFATFDLRIAEPNKEPAIAPAAMHSLEQLMDDAVKPNYCADFILRYERNSANSTSNRSTPKEA